MSTLATSAPARYSVIPRRFWALKAEFSHLALPKTVSLHGSLPTNPDAYEVVERGFSIYDAKRNTYSNYFHGKVGIDTREEGEAIIAALTVTAKFNLHTANA